MTIIVMPDRSEYDLTRKALPFDKGLIGIALRNNLTVDQLLVTLIKSRDETKLRREE